MRRRWPRRGYRWWPAGTTAWCTASSVCPASWPPGGWRWPRRPGSGATGWPRAGSLPIVHQAAGDVAGDVDAGRAGAAGATRPGALGGLSRAGLAALAIGGGGVLLRLVLML